VAAGLGPPRPARLLSGSIGNLPEPVHSGHERDRAGRDGLCVHDQHPARAAGSLHAAIEKEGSRLPFVCAVGSLTWRNTFCGLR